jgi:hypothetical protein
MIYGDDIRDIRCLGGVNNPHLLTSWTLYLYQANRVSHSQNICVKNKLCWYETFQVVFTRWKITLANSIVIQYLQNNMRNENVNETHIIIFKRNILNIMKLLTELKYPRNWLCGIFVFRNACSVYVAEHISDLDNKIMNLYLSICLVFLFL